ncbi:MAG: pyridoxamine 5'-phosphate oxidase family protein [Candidatus Solibacter sp.]
MRDNRKESLAKLNALLKDVRTCMLTSKDLRGNLHARPMALQSAESDGDLWFFTARHCHKVDEVKGDNRVNVSVMDGSTYLSIAGEASLVDDKKKATELWNPLYKAWFPKGLEDPELLLLKVTIEQAEYWDNPGGVVTTLIAYVESLATGKQASPGEHATVRL